MNSILIETESSLKSVSVSNSFIDRFLADANGTYVKVYLYLLRCFQGNDMQFSITSAADFLGETENDIKRALVFWEKKSVLALKKSGSQITGITLMDLDTPTKKSQLTNSNTAVISLTDHIQTEYQDNGIAPEKTKTYDTSFSFTHEDIDKALNNPEISMLANVIETYLERLVNDEDVALISFMYNDLHFSQDVILHLYETCIARNKKSNKYIQAVAIKWAEAGVTTVEEAERNSISFNAYFNAVNTAFNLGRPLGDKEQQYIKNWEQMGFSPELVKEACDRALLKKSKVDFYYANRIIEKWNEDQIKDFEALKKSDEEFLMQKQAKTAKVKASEGRDRRTAGNVTKSAQEYNSRYQQRNYSAADMEEIERLLVGKATGN